MAQQLHSELNLSTEPPEHLATWRVFLECAWAVIDILDAEMQAERGMTIRWYDVLVHVENAENGLRMTEVANRILASKSGLTRVIDRMEEAGLVRRERPPDDRRAINVFITPAGREALSSARAVHRRGIQEHFLSQLTDSEATALAQTLEKVREHVRPLRPGRVSG